MASVVEVLKQGLVVFCLQVRGDSFERLNACAFIETVQIFRRVEIKIDDVFHFREEIRIGNLQVILAAVRT